MLQVHCLAEQAAAADAFQRPLRARFQARLSRSVDMTSDVKGGEPLFTSASYFPFSLSAEPEPGRDDG